MLIDTDRLTAALGGFASSDWTSELVSLCEGKLAPGKHGDLPAWTSAIDALPVGSASPLSIEHGAVCAHPNLSDEQQASCEENLQHLVPWRKGPFRIDDIVIDTEWRSDLKWDRLAGAISALDGRRVLDVGSGNGYYALRMCQAGAKLALGVDPTLLFVAQFAAITRFLQPTTAFVLPLRLHELPEGGPAFDTVFSMGVLYHQRQPAEHLAQLLELLAPGGELVLETLIIPGTGHDILVPDSRYARMRNVWHLPTEAQLVDWVNEAGFGAVRVADIADTTIDEQRTTQWMPFESLREALMPDDPSKTLEGYPSPRRIILTANKSNI